MSRKIIRRNILPALNTVATALDASSTKTLNDYNYILNNMSTACTVSLPPINLHTTPIISMKPAIIYKDLVTIIKEECATINLQYSKEGDGRLVSAVAEKDYLDALETRLKARNAAINVERPKERHWYDVRINGIPINLKITSGGTDNAFNKTAIYYTFTGQEFDKHNMNYNEWFNYILAASKKTKRIHESEYHYLVVDKATGKVLFKSILDIHSYKSNPCNIMQINWKNEFANSEYAIDDSKFIDKQRELLQTVQTSIRKSIESMKAFADADISKIDFSHPVTA